MISRLVCLTAGLIIATSLRAESVQQRFLEGLRERQQYRLAEAYGLRQWARGDLSDRDRADLAIGLALVYTDHALASPPEARAALWKKADDVCEALVADWPESSRRQLVEVQRALVALARGQQQREEAVGTASAAATQAEALTNLRAASTQLAELADTVNKQLIAERMRPGGNTPPDALSPDELQSLLANISYQLARAQRQLGLCYAPRTADRDDALLQALKRLEPLVQQTDVDELSWKARLEAAACQRELGQLQQAWERLEAWSKDNPPPDAAARIAAERVRLLLAGGRIDTAQQLAGQAVAAATTDDGDLALAHLEASLAAWKDASSKGQDANSDKLTAEVSAIGRQYGPYWARQAQLLVGRALAGAAPIGNAAGLMLAAKNLYLNGQAAEALATYDRAIAEFERSQQENEAFAAAMTAAAIEQDAGRLADAAGRYRQLSLRYSRNARAAEAHRQAILCVADVLREKPAQEQQQWAGAYDDLLAEHLANWPRGSTADEVRWWLGRLLAGRHEWAAAREVLEQIVPSSPNFPAAVYLVVDCYQHELEQLGSSPRRAPERAELLEAATNYLQPIVAATRARPPAEWTELERSTVVSLAQLHLRYADGLPTYAVELLGRVIRAAFAGTGDKAETLVDAAWQQKIASLYIVALARIGKFDEARDLMQWQAGTSPSALPATLAGLGERLEADGPGSSRDTAELILEGWELLGPQANTVDKATQRKLVRMRASALAAAGRRDEAIAAFARLADELPDDGQVQESYAALLAGSDSAAEMRAGLARWQQVEERSRKGSPRWRRARQARIELLSRLGDDEAAEKLLRLTRLLYPDWDRGAS